MKLSEMTFTIGENGSLTIPTDIIAEMGLQAGDSVRVAYLTTDGVMNDFQELLLYDGGMVESDESQTQTIQIPTELMRRASITEETDLQIICLDGALLICRDTVIGPGELASVLDSMKTATRLADILPEELGDARNHLEQLIEEYEEGAE